MGNALRIVEQVQDEDFIALLMARNRLGPALHLEELLQRNGIDLDAFDQLNASPALEAKIKIYSDTLQKEGFGVEAKAAVLHECSMSVLYEIATSKDQPGNTRIQAVVALGDVAGKSKKTQSATATVSSDRFQLIINLGEAKEDKQTFEGVATEYSPPVQLGLFTNDAEYSDEAAAYEVA